MIKFIHKKRLYLDDKVDKIIIYYNVLDVFMSIVLLSLITFFIHDYLYHALNQSHNNVDSCVNQQS